MAELFNECIPNPTAPDINWALRNEFEPFLNRKTCEYSIVVDTTIDGKQYESGGTDINRLKEYVDYGVQRLYEHYNKALNFITTGTDLDLCTDPTIGATGLCTDYLFKKAESLLESREINNDYTCNRHSSLYI